MTPSSASRSPIFDPDRMHVHVYVLHEHHPRSAFFLVHLGPTASTFQSIPYMTDSARLSSCRSSGRGITRGGGRETWVLSTPESVIGQNTAKMGGWGRQTMQTGNGERDQSTKLDASKVRPVRRRELATKTHTVSYSPTNAKRKRKETHRGKTAMFAIVFHTQIVEVFTNHRNVGTWNRSNRNRSTRPGYLWRQSPRHT